MPVSHTSDPWTKRRNLLKAWWQAARPPFYIVTLIPITLGFLDARRDTGADGAPVFAGALLVCFLLHLCANLGNDVFDHLQGTDSPEGIGGSRVLQEGKLGVRPLVLVVALCYVLALLLTWVGVRHTGLAGLWPLTLFGMFSSFFYVAPPVRYGYRALGEIFVFLNMGPVMVMGAYYAVSGSFSLRVAALSMPVGLMVAGILYYQSLPEIESDKRQGKTTLAGLLGPEKAFFLFKLWWPAVWTLLLMLFFTGLCSWQVLPGIALSLPPYIMLCHRLDQTDGDWFSLDRYGHLARLMYLFCGLALLTAVWWP